MGLLTTLTLRKQPDTPGQVLRCGLMPSDHSERLYTKLRGPPDPRPVPQDTNCRGQIQGFVGSLWFQGLLGNYWKGPALETP